MTSANDGTADTETTSNDDGDGTLVDSTNYLTILAFLSPGRTRTKAARSSLGSQLVNRDICVHP